MSAARTVARGAGASAGVVAGLIGGAYGGQRIAAARLRRSDDEGGAALLDIAVTPTRQLQTHDCGTISLADYGTGRPIVLSHGVTLTMRTWALQVEPLVAAGFRVIAFDHRGHGASRLGSAGHSVENLGDDVLTVLEGLDLHDAVFVGHSMGGIAVQSFLARHADVARDRMRGIVLLSTIPAAPGGSQSLKIKKTFELLTRRSPDTTRLWAAPNVGLMMARFGFGKDPKPSQVELVRQMMRDCSHETRTHAARNLVGFDLIAELAKIEVPTLIICGTADLITPPFHSRRMARGIPGSRLELLDGGGHMLMLERSEIVNRLIIDFASDH
jgi:pimeloyl-ACP methyl ester carboxylesterase